MKPLSVAYISRAPFGFSCTSKLTKILGTSLKGNVYAKSLLKNWSFSVIPRISCRDVQVLFPTKSWDCSQHITSLMIFVNESIYIRTYPTCLLILLKPLIHSTSTFTAALEYQTMLLLLLFMYVRSGLQALTPLLQEILTWGFQSHPNQLSYLQQVWTDASS